jgi:predicted phosphodiesterase
MRIALISDIHGNLISLEEVLADIAQVGVDQIIFLGDLVTFGAQPREAVERIQALGCSCVLGNHDDFVLERSRVPHLSWVSEWFAAQLSADQLAFLRTFQPTIRIPLDDAGHTLLCCHGSPRSYNEFLLATTPPEVLDEIIAQQIAPHPNPPPVEGREPDSLSLEGEGWGEGEISEVLVAIACGHTHVPLIRRHNDLIIMNVGSVGLPFEELPFKGYPVMMPWAEYGIVEWQDGRLTTELRRLPVDVEKIKQTYRASGMPDTDYFLERWSAWRGV